MIGGLCKWDGVSVYEELRDVLLSGIKNNIVRELDPIDHAELVKKLQEDNTREKQEENRSVQVRERGGWVGKLKERKCLLCTCSFPLNLLVYKVLTGSSQK